MNMETRLDFLNWLDRDMSMKILMCLEDPSDLFRASCVSRSWRHFVVTDGLCKQLCLRLFPQLSRVDRVIDCMKKSVDVGSSEFMEWEILEREHRIYAFLAQGFKSFAARDCISRPICASSTDNYPEESIHNTLQAGDRIAHRASYWSSKGQQNPAVPETLTYKLVGDLCVITEINIQPFQAYFQWGLPIYSAKAVRFRMGHMKSAIDEPLDSALDNFVWNYTSQEFPMAQENRLQNFKFPEPVLCIGGVLQIELLGRVQRQEMDELFYICVSHVQVLGQSLSPAFGIEILDHSGKYALKALTNNPLLSSPEDDPGDQNLHRRVRDLEQILNLLRDNGVGIQEFEFDEEDDDESDEEFVL